MHVEHNVSDAPTDTKLNDELLLDGNVEDEKSAEPKRNSKDDLMAKIISVCADNELELEHSNSKLRRMTKQQLCKILAEKIEEGVKSQMAKQVGAKPGCGDNVIALGALKMMHNLLANSAEKGLNVFLPSYGYEVVGFSESLKDPHVDEAVSQCLHEIALESDVMQYIESPYVRLAIAWGGALVTSIRKKHRSLNHRHAATMVPLPTRKENPVQPCAGRRPQTGKVYSSERPCPPNAKTV